MQVPFSLHRRLASIALLVTVLLGPASSAEANDTAIGGHGVTLGPMQESRVRMAAESIVVTQTGWDEWSVEATYTFENLAQETVSLQMGFPEPRCPQERRPADAPPDWEPSDWVECRAEGDFRFREMLIRVDGTPVPVRRDRIGAQSPWYADYDVLHLFDVTFAPGQRLPIVHQYRFQGNQTAGNLGSFSYVTRTGSTWATPIGLAEFEYRLLPTTCMVDVPPGATLTREGPTGQWVVRERFVDWTPTDDRGLISCAGLVCCLGPDPAVGGTTCPSPYDALAEDNEAAAADWATRLTPEQARICRNLPYALFGHHFRDAALFSLFYGPTATADAPPPAPVTVTGTHRDDIGLGRTPNPFAARAELDLDANRYVTFLQRIEAIQAAARPQ